MVQGGNNLLGDISLGMLPQGGRGGWEPLEWMAHPRTQGSCALGRLGVGRRAEGVAAGEGLRTGRAGGHHSEKGEGKGGHRHPRKVVPCGGEVGTGVQGHKQGMGPGTGHLPKAEGYGCSGVTHTASAGKGTGCLKERNDSLRYEYILLMWTLSSLDLNTFKTFQHHLSLTHQQSTGHHTVPQTALWPQDRRAQAAVVGRVVEHRGAHRVSAWARAGARSSSGQLRVGAGAGQSYPNCTRFKTRNKSNEPDQTGKKKKK